jgi:hypothetical protein
VAEDFWRDGGQADGGSDLLTFRIGFVVDVAEYGRRSAPAQAGLGRRLTGIITGMVNDVGFGFEEADNDGGSGDGMAVFLPVGADHTRVLPGLIRSAAGRLSRDNEQHRDRVRLRMAIGSGLLGFGPAGFTGRLIIELNRLVDSASVRRALAGDPGRDIAVLVSNTLHEEVVGPGYLDSDLWSFQRVRVAVKEYYRPAWLWSDC